MQCAAPKAPGCAPSKSILYSVDAGKLQTIGRYIHQDYYSLLTTHLFGHFDVS